MSKKSWKNQVNQDNAGDNPAEGQETMDNEQSTENNEQSTELVELQQLSQDEASVGSVEGAETGVEQDAESNEQSTAPVVQVTMGIGQFCRHMMLNSSKSNTEILNLVLKLYPDAKTTMACIAWYKSDLRKKGLLQAGDKARSTKLVEFSAEDLAEMIK